ncbi:MAG: response regulator [Planctomycetes bacterium]|nr:response regulator [Planctomycetota bacterium]
MHLHALVVNGSESSRATFVRFLKESKLADFTFTEARNARDGIVRLDPLGTNVVFLEWEGPQGMNLEFVRKVRAKQRRHIPVVVVTTDAELVRLEQSADDGGVDYYLLRPFTLVSIRQKLAPFITRLTAQNKAATARSNF